MNGTANIHQAGIQINFKGWERFDLENLTNDGVVLFQYLVFHCQSNAEWTHSDNGLRSELGIKRARLEALRAKFTELGILSTRIVKDRNDNDIRAYRLDFTELSKLSILKTIYRTHSPQGEPYNLSEYADVFRALARNQPKLGAAKVKAEQVKDSEIRQLADKMKATFDSRRNNFNAEISKAKKGRVLSGSVVFSPAHLRKLKNAVAAIGDKNFIHDAFLVYGDLLNELGGEAKARCDDHKALLPELPRSPLNYFLSYSAGGVGESGNFSVIHAFGAYFASHYGRSV